MDVPNGTAGTDTAGTGTAGTAHHLHPEDIGCPLAEDIVADTPCRLLLPNTEGGGDAESPPRDASTSVGGFGGSAHTATDMMVAEADSVLGSPLSADVVPATPLTPPVNSGDPRPLPAPTDSYLPTTGLSSLPDDAKLPRDQGEATHERHHRPWSPAAAAIVTPRGSGWELHLTGFSIDAVFACSGGAIGKSHCCSGCCAIGNSHCCLHISTFLKCLIF